ncbi:nucleotide-binding protein [Psychrosphaera saromensis]|uniref:RNase adaptor protein RapZ n=1 Tax=Psychrosphaera saromensis TaxID=716813 RepID=A0A2S7UVB9_9GAMM|nr:RNase adapter RapZ [Psychrosphaera saromensis]PQJ53210.1 RNase adaptor protein RapZ [Psychrosphaera saromensis]GHB67137.1 nucleotide-binding protein [Psychrosphaera saromensis]GLQ15027.1 nucleotide-binding protein [Psychrosphaera saromensis]
MHIFIVSGRSGSGKTVVLRVLEDLGYYCVDNLPVNLLPALSHSLEKNYDQVAVSIDVRNLPTSEQELLDNLDFLPKNVNVTVLYIDASDDVLIRRYSETRRLHPLSKGESSLPEAIAQESKLLDELANRADLYIDTSQLNVHQLTEMVREKILGKSSKELVLTFESFGFKYGVPNDIDFVFDARFLPNPHWEPELRPLTGLDLPVREYLSGEPLVNKFTFQINNFISTWLPHLERNNRSYLTIAIGCTGGKHRSVYIAETLARQFKSRDKNIRVRHREMARYESEKNGK